MVALVQAATSLPVFLVGLPAGALADVVDRRRLLLWTQGGMLAAALVLGALTLLGQATPWALLTLTFALGLGAAMNAPAWQAIVSELVPRSELQAAVALNGVGFNIARVIGPALGGLVIAAAGSGMVFLLNAVSFLGVMVVLYRWHRPPRESALPAERMLGAIRAGMRYVRHTPDLRAVLVRSSVFILCGSALWALLPLFARSELGLDATGYGVLLGCLGAGAIVGAVFLPRVRLKVAVDPLIAGATIVFAVVTLLLAATRHFAVLCVAMTAGGIAWMALMSTFNVAAQTTAPAWVRARALAVYLLILQGGMAVGSTLWGAVAAQVGIPMSFVCAASGLVAGLNRHAVLPFDGERRNGPDTVAALARASGSQRTPPGGWAGLGNDRVPDKPGAVAWLRAGDASPQPHAPAGRRDSVGLVLRCRGSRSLCRDLSCRVLGRASAPTRTSDYRGSCG